MECLSTKVFHWAVDHEVFIWNVEVDGMCKDLLEDDLFGINKPFNVRVYAKQ